jgi:hypothetical protein
MKWVKGFWPEFGPSAETLHEFRLFRAEVRELMLPMVSSTCGAKHVLQEFGIARWFRRGSLVDRHECWGRRSRGWMVVAVRDGP